jgi:hypothetical protein
MLISSRPEDTFFKGCCYIFEIYPISFEQMSSFFKQIYTRWKKLLVTIKNKKKVHKRKTTQVL